MLQIIFYAIIIFVQLQIVTPDVSDYCAENTFSSNDNSMQFTKEAVINEYAIVGNFKALHCCAKGYRSIEWFKDDRPYPWPDTASKLFLYPQSANQTIHTPSVTAESAGNYTCLLKNDSIVKAHTIKLFVYDKVPDEPKVTYVSSDQEVNLDDTTRLFCEAFLGHVDLPDAHYEATWTKQSRNGDYINENNSRITQEKVSREDNQIFGTYLTINNFEQDDVGLYTCKISKPGRTKEYTIVVREKEVYTNMKTQSKINWHYMILLLSISLTLILCVVCLYQDCRVKIRDRFSHIKDDNKMDVLLLYSNHDFDIANDIIKKVLSEKFRYKCLSRVLPPYTNNTSPTNIIADIPEIAQCKKILIILSPKLLNDNWTRNSIYQAIKYYCEFYDSNAIYVTLEKIPEGQEVKNSQGESLTSILRKVTLFVFEFTKRNNKRFWLNLRYKLPPNRNNVNNNSIPINFARNDDNNSNNNVDNNSLRLTISEFSNDTDDQLV